MDELLDHAPCGFLTFADDGIVVAINATLLHILGYDGAEVVGKHIEHLLPVGTKIFYQTHWFPMLSLHGHAEEVFLFMRSRTGENVGMLSYAHRRRDRQLYDCVLVQVKERAKYEDELLRARRTAEASNAELKVQQQELERVNEQLESQTLELELQQQQLREQAALLEVAAADLTATNAALQIRTEEAEKLRKIADEANRAKSTFLAMMSHELRTPLNAIGGYLQILELEIAGPISDAQRDILGRLEKSSRHLLRLINDVLDLSRIEAGRVDYEVEDTLLANVVAGVVPMIEPQLASKSIRLSVDVPSDLVVRADIEKLQQILLNLLSNAAKFTGENGRVDVWAARPRDRRDRVEVHVRDTGIGIPAEQLEAIFQPFVQVDASRTRNAEGSGLGLAISRDLARGMAGELSAASEVGKGSTFTLILASRRN